jgi:hypothetical protein
VLGKMGLEEWMGFVIREALGRENSSSNNREVFLVACLVYFAETRRMGCSTISLSFALPSYPFSQHPVDASTLSVQA